MGAYINEADRNQKDFGRVFVRCNGGALTAPTYTEKDRDSNRIVTGVTTITRPQYFLFSDTQIL